MENPAILKMNLEHFRRLLEIEADSAKRQTILKLIRETEAELHQDRLPSKAFAQTGRHDDAQLSALIGTEAGGRRAGVSAAKSPPPENRRGSLLQRDAREVSRAALHELSERLTATTNYIASALRLSEIASVPAAMPANGTQILETALDQISLADETINRFRQVWDEDTGGYRPIYGARNSGRAPQKAELRQAQNMELLGQLTGGVVHDIRNLLAVLQGNLEMLSGRQGSDQLQAKVDMALQTIERGARLTGQLLCFARRQPPKRSPTVDLNAQLRTMTELLATIVGNTITIETDLSPELWLVFIDVTQLELAVINLVINARDAMPAGGVLRIRTSNTTLSGDEDHAGDFVALGISDTGTGMPPDILACAFEPFFTTKEPGKGTGLGLSMVYGFARESKGTAAIRSEIGRGTAVTLHLPRSPERAARAIPSEAASDTGLHRGASQ
jgi:signal transduction histidine kinase